MTKASEHTILEEVSNQSSCKKISKACIKASYLRWFCLFLVLSSNGISQLNLDSLLKLDLSAQTPAQQVETYINISREHLIANQYEEGVISGKKGVDIARKLKNDTLLGKVQLFVGINYSEVDLDSAIYYCYESYKNLEPHAHPWAFYGLDNYMQHLMSKSDYPNALKGRLEELKFHTQKQDTSRIIGCLTKIGYLYDRISYYNEALSWHRQAIALAEVYGDSIILGDAMGYIGIVFDELEAYDSAHYYNQEALKSYLADGNDIDYRMWCSNIGNTYIKQEKWNLAKEYLEKSLENESMNFGGNAVKLLNLGHVFFYLNQIDSAKKYLNLGLEMSIATDQYDRLSEGNYYLSLVAEKENNFEESLRFYKLYQSYKDSVFNELKANQIAFMQVQFDTEQKEKEILIAKNEKQQISNEKLALDLELSQRSNLLYIILALFGLLSVIGVLIFIRVRNQMRREQTEAVLREKDAGTKAILDAQENERGKISRDLHDSVVQDLTVIKNQAELLIKDSPESLSKALASIVNELQKSTTEVRNLSHQLMPLALRELGLVPALEDMLEKTLKNKNIQFEYEVLNIDGRLQEKIEVSLYRVAQELVNNIIKHSGADYMMLTLSKRAGFVTMIIEDNGKGFDPEEKGKGIGLTSIRSRVHLVQGELKYELTENKGTTTIIRIPCD